MTGNGQSPIKRGKIQQISHPAGIIEVKQAGRRLVAHNRRWPLSSYQAYHLPVRPSTAKDAKEM
jgi:hypothetical protein